MRELTENAAPGAAQHTQPDLISVRRFRADMGIAPSTPWRWIKRGWLGQPLNIGGRLYLTREQLDEFNRRATAGEFAASIKPPTPTRRSICG